MKEERLDCSWCGSARSIEYKMCQVCLMEYPMDTKVIRLPERGEQPVRRFSIEETVMETGVAE